MKCTMADKCGYVHEMHEMRWVPDSVNPRASSKATLLSANFCPSLIFRENQASGERLGAGASTKGLVPA